MTTETRERNRAQTEVRSEAERIASIEALIAATLPHLATKADLAAIPHMATQAQLEQVRGEFMSELKEMESRIIRWIIGVAIALAAVLVASIALADRLLG